MDDPTKGMLEYLDVLLGQKENTLVFYTCKKVYDTANVVLSVYDNERHI